MRETRTVELDPRQSPKRLLIRGSQTLRVTSGQIWVTIEGSVDDFWLSSGESLDLDSSSVVWISSEKDDSRFLIGPVDELRTFRAKTRETCPV